MRELSRRWEVAAVAAIVLAAAAARLVRLDLMEFKADEAEACRLALHVLGYSEPGVGRFFPTEGLTASIGVPNPPLFVYLVALPLAIVRSPLAAAVGVALANVAAVFLCYVAGRRIYSRFVGLASAALLACAPWAIVFSRKIWAQDLLPLVTTLFLLELHALLVRRREHAVATTIVLVAVGTQLHFSAVVLLVLLVVALVLAREAVTLRSLLVGIGVSLLLYAPFLVVHGGTLLHSHPHSASAAPDLLHRLLDTSHLTAAIGGADKLSFLVGSQPPLGRVLALLLAAVAATGLVLGWVRARGTRLGELRGLLVLWYGLPAALLTVLPSAAYIHYFIVLLPLPFLGMARAVEELAGRTSSVAAGAVVLVLVYFVVVDSDLFRTVVDHGGAPGDYGVAYRYKSDLVRELARREPGRELVFSAPGGGSEYRYLLWNEQPDLTRASPAQGFTIVERSSAPAVVRAGPVAAQRAQSAPR